MLSQRLERSRISSYPEHRGHSLVEVGGAVEKFSHRAGE